MPAVRIVTIDREYGAGGPAIAAKLADRLGWALWDQRLSLEIARRADCELSAVQKREERKDPLYYRLFKSFLRGSFEATLQANRLGLLDADRILAITSALVREAAAEGRCVIVGRGSQYFLSDRSDVYHVFVYASDEEKIRREQAKGRTAAHARRLVEATDRDRAAFIKTFFAKEWPNRPLYHLMVNSKVGDEAAVETIHQAIAALEAHSGR
jgi:cytidylate kinase